MCEGSQNGGSKEAGYQGTEPLAGFGGRAAKLSDFCKNRFKFDKEKASLGILGLLPIAQIGNHGKVASFVYLVAQRPL